MELVELREVTCRRCGSVFYLCRSCDSGYWYCSDECAVLAREASVRQARKEYARSDKGRANNLLRQRRFRRRNRLKSQGFEKTVTDHSSQGGDSGVPCSHDEHIAPPSPHLRLCLYRAPSIAARSRKVACCHLCGRPGVVVRRAATRGRFRWVDSVRRRT